MKPQTVHTKRRKRTALRKADQYRATANFYRQRNLALLKDLGEEKAEHQKSVFHAKKSKEQFQEDLFKAEIHINRLQKNLIVRAVMWMISLKQY